MLWQCSEGRIDLFTVYKHHIEVAAPLVGVHNLEKVIAQGTFAKSWLFGVNTGTVGKFILNSSTVYVFAFSCKTSRFCSSDIIVVVSSHNIVRVVAM